MVQASLVTAVPTTPQANAGGGRPRPVDLVHLARQTFGDRGLEREILRLFQGQATRLEASVRQASGEERRRQAHRLNGSARSVGAGRIAAVAEAIEHTDDDDRADLLAELAAAVAEASTFIEALLESRL